MSLWTLYSFFYNALNELVPYKEQIGLIHSKFEEEVSLFHKVFIDAGCGTGNLLKNRRNVVGVDMSENMLRVGQDKSPESFLILSDLNQRLPFKDGVFDGGWSNNVIAYVKDPKKTIMELHRVLKPGATFVLATLRPTFNPLAILLDHIKRSCWLSTIKYFFLIPIILLLNIPIVVKLRTGIYHGFEMDTLKQLFEASGFVVKQCCLSYSDQDVFIVATRG